MGECESVRGEWGGICPDCGQRLPFRPGPITSKIQKPSEWAFGTVTGRRWSEAEFEAHKPRAEDALTERQQEVLRMVAKHGGNRNAAARELGIAAPTVFTTIAKLRKRGIEVTV